MANWDDLKASITNVIKNNGNQEITGQLLQNCLNSIVSNVGLNATFAGIATPSTNPGVPDGPVFYIAYNAGIYSYFGGVTLASGLNIILWKENTWSITNILRESRIGFVSLTDGAYVTWYIDEQEINIPKNNFISSNGESYTTNTIINPISYTQNAIKLYFDTINRTVKVYDWDDTKYSNELSSYLYIGYVYNNNICIFGAENQTRIYQNKQSKIYENIHNHVSFHGTSNSEKIVYDPNNKQITFPNGFISIGERSIPFYSQTINLFSVESEENCWKLYFNLNTNQIYATDWATLNIRGNDPVLGYVYKNKVRLINNQDNADVKVIGINSFERIPDFCIFSVPYDISITHNVDAKTIQLTKGCFLINHNATYSISPQILDYSSVELANTAGVIYILLTESTKILHILSWDRFIYDSPYEAKVVGYIYGLNLFLFGVSLNQINVINSSLSEPNPKVAFMSANIDYIRATYDYNTKVIRFNIGAYVIANGKGYPTSNPQDLDVSNIDTDLAYNIFFDINTLQYSKKHWADEQSKLPEDQNKYCIGYVYERYLHIFGVPDKNIRNKNEIIYFFGDSITAGVGTSGTNCYHQFIAQDLNLKCLNYGVGSIGFCVTTSSNVCVGNGAEGQGTWQQEDGNNTILQIMQANNDFQYVSIWAGTNDFGSGIELETFKTSVEETLDYALSITPYVVCATPIRRQSPEQNSKGYTLEQYCNIIKDACEEKGIPCFDAYNNSGLNPMNNVNNNEFYSDGLHTNAKGQKRMAIGYKEFIRYLIQ